jgi:3-oxoacyl-[acyl-carrier protein] reductase
VSPDITNRIVPPIAIKIAVGTKILSTCNFVNCLEFEYNEPSDVSVFSQVNSLIRSTIEKFGSESIDILVNNAGVAFNKRLVDTSEQE